MRALVLAVSALLFCTGNSHAQSYMFGNLPPDYSWEVGANFGYSNITRPLGPANAYQGTRTRSSHDYSLRLNYYFSPHLMINLDLGQRHWESAGTWALNDQFGQPLKPRDIKFVVADHAVNEYVALNYVIPFYTGYNTYNKANLYFGAGFGLMQTMNDASIGYRNYNAAPDSTFRYTSSYNYGAGTGYNFGVQMGYTWYIIPRLGINVDLAVRYAHINTTDTRYGSENKKFYLLYFPETLGIRWRF